MTRDGVLVSIDKAAAWSERAWALTEGALPGTVAGALKAFLKLVRPGRVLMVSVLTWVSADVAGVPAGKDVAITLGGMFLAMAGFAIDAYTDREADRAAPRAWPINPLSAGLLEARTARHIIVALIAVSLTFSFFVHMLTLVPAAVILAVYWGLAAGALDGPFGRAATLGGLQALYVLLAAAATGRITPLLWLIASVFFFAMVGARAAADIRDLPSDEKTATRSLAKAYGLRTTSWILPLALTVSAALAIAVYATGAFDRTYLVLTILGYGMGLAIAWIFPFKASPELAFSLGTPFLLTGFMYMAALYFGQV